MADPASLPWFHGRITRDTAEKCLHKTSMEDGTYLLRESTSQIGSYVLSVCKDRKVVHYQIQKQPSGMVGIADGPKFPGPVELVNHHKTNLDGLMTKLSVACNRLAGVKAKAYNDVSHDDLDEATRVALRDIGVGESEEAVSRFKGDILCVVGNILHKKQPWFHGAIPRNEADRRLETHNFEEGMYLIRERGSYRNSYVLGLCHQKKVYHYLFEPNDKGQLSIKAGRPFDNLMAVVNFYSQKSEGLLCTLKTPCDVRWFEFRPKMQSQNILLHPEIQTELRRTLSRSESELKKYRKGTTTTKPIVPTRPPPSPAFQPVAQSDKWKYEKIYESSKVVMMEGFNSPFQKNKKRDISLDPSRLSLGSDLGEGNFGSVKKGTYVLPKGNQILVAVKTLKEEDIPGQKSEILSEANIMAHLDHPNIVRLIGVTQSPNFMLVMELAPEGPLLGYLKKHRSMPMLNVLILMLQVDEGMNYLESQHFVHRDLAARNILVVSENFVKISDFGMSRAMGAGNEYYRAERTGKWPLKWYAPECIYYHKFTSKGDVWSYGVALWEAVSYGMKPYQGMKGPQIVEMLDNGQRLSRPERCPEEVYALMRKCWETNPDDRPTFHEIGLTLSAYIERERTKRK
ncbi:tyrosine-protein kinase SYK-like [Hydractinia symbiolongicarpus]|uniref:tyrosine-protein kinase SYK-like n=1 Tax=Hydractinia symbiolongicarpus TaxID=13093 RepID=UPI00254AEC87|nr:tyrosine-protein kinase SYK-like [Hydractinia symbiolongicarpus]